ncbi:STAS domain-containing protein [Deltaproteobacteria bacterium TL4]
MEFSYIINDQVCNAYYKGGSDSGNIHLFTDSLLPLIEKDQIKTFIVDITSIDMLNSEGIGQLMQIYKHSLNHKKRMILVINHYIEKVFDIVNLRGILETVESHEEALNRI